MKPYFFYVLYTADGYFYGGFTDDVQRRLATHEKGQGAKFTRVKSRHPLQLLFSEAFDNKGDALRAEAAFKRLTRAKKEDFLVSRGVSAAIWEK